MRRRPIVWSSLAVLAAACSPTPRISGTAPAAAHLSPREATGTSARRGDDVQPYAITLSGGVSLGSYMAGLNWAMLELMRRNAAGDNPDLIGVTGASAGGINALITAMRWCEDDAELHRWSQAEGERLAEEDPAKERFWIERKNLFAATWLSVDLRELLPPEQRDFWGVNDPDNDPDSMFSRKTGYNPVIKLVARRMSAPVYRPGCSLKLGLTVTRTQPRTLNVGGITVGNQRFVIPLVATVNEARRLHFELDTGAAQHGRADLLGNLLFLVPGGGPEMRVDPRAVVSAAQASSAFPLALGPVQLSHCVPARECGGVVDPWKEDVCTAVQNAVGSAEPFVACAEPFVDGGVFDNVPLGVAMAQLESSPRLIDRKRSPYRPLRYLYVEYGNRRKAGRAPAKPLDRGRGPLRETLEAIGGFIDTASDYELHNVLRYNAWNEAGAAPLAREVADFIEAAAGGSGSGAFGSGDCRRSSVAEMVDCLRLAAGGDGPIRASAADLAAALRAAATEIERSLLAPPVSDAAFPGKRADMVALERAVLQAVYSLCTPAGEPTVGLATGRGLCDGRDHGRRLAVRARVLLEGSRGRELLVTTRLSPLSGTHATHFAALLDRPLREYDFYAGIYDALWTHAQAGCDLERRKVELEKLAAPPAAQPALEVLEVEQTGDQLKKGIFAVAQEEDRTPWPGRADCLAERFKEARGALDIGIDPVGELVLDALHEVEVAHRYGGPIRLARASRAAAAPAIRVMRALLDPRRCPRWQRTSRNVCLADREFNEFATSLERHDYRPGTPFMQWALSHPSEEEWWLLPASYATARLHDLTHDEGRPQLNMVATLARVHVETSIDEVDDSRWVAPSSLPDREGRGWGLLFPFAALSVHPTRRFELGLVRGGLRVDHVDLLADTSIRVMVVPPPPGQEDDLGYGLFTRGFSALTASLAPTYRFGKTIFSTLAVRGGVPVRGPQPLKAEGPWQEEVSFELVLTMIDSKFRAAIGCHPWEAEPRDGCWRHPYYSFGVNDLAGIAYWTGLNPFQRRRFLLPFIAPRLALTSDPEAGRDQAVELAILRGGWGRGDGPGLDLDLSTVLPLAPGEEDAPEVTANLSASLLWRLSYEALHGLGVRATLPLSVQENARFDDVSFEAFLVGWKGIRAALGWYLDPVELEDGGELPPWYASLGLDFDAGPLADAW